MKFSASIRLLALILAVSMTSGNAWAMGHLAPKDFNKMYYLAAKGKVGFLREAVNRGLNIDSLNANGDTGLCVAVKRNDYIAYNSFRMSGANPRHACTHRLGRTYREFLESNRAADPNKVVGNEKSLYYQEDEKVWWPWILGGAAVGGIIWAASSGGGGSDYIPPEEDDTIRPIDPGYGLAMLVSNYKHTVSNGSVVNKLARDIINPNAEEYRNEIEMLPNVLDNADYLMSYIRVNNGAQFVNDKGGDLLLTDATIGATVYDENSIAVNEGNIDIEAQNGAIGLVVSNGGQAYNGTVETGTSNESYGRIDMTFQGSKEGDVIAGMFADTQGKIVNYGQIIGTTSDTIAAPDDENTSSGSDSDVLLDDEGGDEDTEKAKAANSGSILGMVLFDHYTGTNLSANTVTADNYGKIFLTAGYSSATEVAVSLVGMGSYIDDDFLNGKSNPNFAEKMNLSNYGDISLSYSGIYNLADTALKLGDGGLIGMRADASTIALNQGNIKIDLTNTKMDEDLDVAAAQLSVHGGVLINGDEKSIYSESNTQAPGVISVINEAASGGVSYGMFAVQGDGTQTRLIEWTAPLLYNYGLIDMQASNSYAMASFAGGELINYGVINVGVENGDSKYTNNYGIYAAGGDLTKEITVINKGVINVAATESYALYNAFAGSVSLVNDGYIYLSSKATDSNAFGGNFSTAINNGSILYKVDNSKTFSKPQKLKLEDIGYAVEPDLVAKVAGMSVDETAPKQFFVNNGDITLGLEEDFEAGVDYGGTYGTAVASVGQQGGADNRGTITLRQFEKDIPQFNVGLYLEDATTMAAYANNNGVINVDAVASVGIRNDSTGGATATNFGQIYVNGDYSYGMAAKNGSTVFNGRVGAANNENAVIYVKGTGAAGIYLKDSNAIVYGNTVLAGNGVSAFVIDGEQSSLQNLGKIIHDPTAGYMDVTYYTLTGSASKIFMEDDLTINGYTLAKAVLNSEGTGGKAYFYGSAQVTGSEQSRLFYAEGSGSNVYNYGSVVVDSGAYALEAKDGASISNVERTAVITVNDENSRGMYGTKTNSLQANPTLSNLSNAIINVNAGYGIYGDSETQISNSGEVNVSDGTGIYVEGLETYAANETNGKITADGKQAVGIVASYGAEVLNAGIMNVAVSDCVGSDCQFDDYAYGIKADHRSTVDNTGTISANSNSVAVYVSEDATFTNNGNISVNSASAYGIYANDALSVSNVNNIYVGAGTGVYVESGTVDNDGVIEVRNNGKGMWAGTGGIANNTSNIAVYSGIGMYLEGEGNNSGTISLSADAKGVWVDGGHFYNTNTISGTGTGIYITNGGEAENNSKIDLKTGYGAHIDGSGKFYNNQDISITSGTGIYIDGASASAINSGTITISKEGYGAYITNGGSFLNKGTITYDSSLGGNCTNKGENGECVDQASQADDITTASLDAHILTVSEAASDLIYVENGTFVNSGEVDFSGTTMDFDTLSVGDEAAFVVADGGTYKADSFSGKVVAGKDIVMNGFDDTYINKDSFVGENNGLEVSSESYMFTAEIKDDGEAMDVELNRKEFDELIEDKEVASFFETNYALEHNEKIYNVLKAAENKQEFDYATEVETGKQFYANLPRENMAVLRGLNSVEQRRILEDGLNGVSVGADYYRTGKDASGGLSGYSDDVYSAYLGFGERLNHHLSIGGSLRAAYADADYDEAQSSRENKILMAFMPILYQNGDFQFLTTPSFGVGYGSYKRRALSGTYEADTLDFYYGLYNHAEYSVDVKVAELVAEAELNVQGASMSRAKEDDGLILKANDSVSVEGGIGLKLRKRIQLAKERSLMLAIGTKYYHEFADPYKTLKATMGGSPVDYSLSGYDEDKNRLKTTAEVVYKDGDLAVAAEISHNAEKESNIEGGVGVRYGF